MARHARAQGQRRPGNMSEASPARVIPLGSLLELGNRFGLEPKEWDVHRSRRRSAARRRTASQDSPGESPARTRSARRSISAAHSTSIVARILRHVKADNQLSGDIRSLPIRQRKRLAQGVLASRSHGAILSLQPSAFGRQSAGRPLPAESGFSIYLTRVRLGPAQGASQCGQTRCLV